MSWMTTNSVKRFPLIPWQGERIEQHIILDDIATALSRQVRFNGHGKHEITVAEHCINVAEMLPDPFKIYGLMHDAAEAYIGDIVHPVKELSPEINRLEWYILGDIQSVFGLDNPAGVRCHPGPPTSTGINMVSTLVRTCDLAAVGLEAALIFGPWVWDEWESLKGKREALTKYHLSIIPGHGLPRSAIKQIFIDHFKPYMLQWVEYKTAQPEEDDDELS